MSNRPNVIVADRDERFLVYLSTLLGRMNFEVLPVRSAQEAFELARIVKPDLFFFEAACGDAENLETIRKISRDNRLTKTPFIMVGDSDACAEQYFEAGCSDFVTRPIGLTFLHLSLQKCLPNREGMRRYLRAPFNRNITFEFAGLEVSCFAITLSEGGVYLRTNKPLPVNSKVSVKLPLEPGEVILDGTVIYTMGLAKGPFLIPPGMAILFNEEQQDSRVKQDLSDEICRLLIGDIVDEQEEPVFRCGRETDDSPDTQG